MKIQIPIQTKPALWGMAGGAVAMAIVGFTWGGWTTSGKAEAVALERANDAVVVALAPICADRFRHSADVSANLAAFGKAEAWAKGDFLEKGGWATVPGTNSPDRVTAIANACALLLAPV